MESDSMYTLKSSLELYDLEDDFVIPVKQSSAVRREGRKLTYDWYQEIKLDSGQVLLYRRKGAPTPKCHPGYIEVTKSLRHFCTGSSYEGNYNALGFAGFGEYTYPHGVKYEGYFKNGHFHGAGTLTYPMGQQIDGTWKKGRLINFTFRFPDGLVYTTPWKYCQQPDRSFQSEVLNGLHTAGEEYRTNQQPTKKLKDGCYDTVDGYFDPTTKCVYKDEDEDDEEEESEESSEDAIYRQKPEILRVCTKMEEDFIVPHYRKAADDTVGYRPDLYENWTTGIKQEYDEITKSEKQESEVSFSTATINDSSSIISSSFTESESIYRPCI